jgi:hypothetical protein
MQLQRQAAGQRTSKNPPMRGYSLQSCKISHRETLAAGSIFRDAHDDSPVVTGEQNPVAAWSERDVMGVRIIGADDVHVVRVGECRDERQNARLDLEMFCRNFLCANDALLVFWELVFIVARTINVPRVLSFTVSKPSDMCVTPAFVRVRAMNDKLPLSLSRPETEK